MKTKEIIWDELDSLSCSGIPRAKCMDYIQQIQLDALKEGMRRAANTTVGAYPHDVQRQELETAFDKGLNEHRKAILTAAEQLTINDL